MQNNFILSDKNMLEAGQNKYYICKMREVVAETRFEVLYSAPFMCQSIQSANIMSEYAQGHI